MGVRKNIAVAASAEASRDRQYIKSLARGFEVLRAFRSEDRGISNAELARRTGLPKPTLSRLTFTLLSLGYLHLDEETGRYSLHPQHRDPDDHTIDKIPVDVDSENIAQH